MTTIAFDCDDTLLWPSGSPRRNVVDLWNAFQGLGNCRMVVWSAQGVEYAKQVNERLKLHADEIWDQEDLSNQPDICVDDYPFQRGKVTVVV